MTCTLENKSNVLTDSAKKTIRKALKVLGKKNFAFIMHNGSFPSAQAQNTGFGSINTDGGKEFIEYASGLFDAIQLGPAGKTKSCGCINYSIGEQNIITILNKFNIPYIKEYTEFSLNKKRFDFAILDDTNKIIRLVEFDGIQHTDPTKGWSRNAESLKIIQQRDEEKNQWAKKHNIPLVRIPYTERDNITLDIIMGDKYLI